MTPSFPSLHYSSTVGRDMVHKNAVNEVFLTDSAEHDGHYYFGAELPTSHSYYNDTEDRQFDTLAIVEASRQAETMLAHKYLGVEKGTHFLLHQWQYSISDLSNYSSSDKPMSLLMDVKVSNQRHVGTRLRSASENINIFVKSNTSEMVKVGKIDFDVSYVTPETYAAVRAAAPTEIARSTELTAVPTTVEPDSIGRSLPSNVVVTNPERSSHGMRAQLRPPLNNRSMFDHAQDHVPAMVIMEAARQLIALCNNNPSFSLDKVAAKFNAYTELSEPAYIECMYSHDNLTVSVTQLDKQTAFISMAIGSEEE